MEKIACIVDIVESMQWWKVTKHIYLSTPLKYSVEIPFTLLEFTLLEFLHFSSFYFLLH